MSRDVCKLSSCDREPGASGSKKRYNEKRFCSPKCELKYEHLKADATDARQAEQERLAEEREP